MDLKLVSHVGIHFLILICKNKGKILLNLDNLILKNYLKLNNHKVNRIRKINKVMVMKIMNEKMNEIKLIDKYFYMNILINYMFLLFMIKIR